MLEAYRCSERAIFQNSPVNVPCFRSNVARPVTTFPRIVNITRAGLHGPIVAVAEPFHSPSYVPAASPICGDNIQDATEARKSRRFIALSLLRGQYWTDVGGQYTPENDSNRFVIRQPHRLKFSHCGSETRRDPDPERSSTWHGKARLGEVKSARMARDRAQAQGRCQARGRPQSFL